VSGDAALRIQAIRDALDALEADVQILADREKGARE
jgi:hypothetical protein